MPASDQREIEEPERAGSQLLDPTGEVARSDAPVRRQTAGGGKRRPLAELQADLPTGQLPQAGEQCKKHRRVGIDQRPTAPMTGRRETTPAPAAKATTLRAIGSKPKTRITRTALSCNA